MGAPFSIPPDSDRAIVLKGLPVLAGVSRLALRLREAGDHAAADEVTRAHGRIRAALAAFKAERGIE